MNLAARAARLTMWIWDIPSDKVWVNPRSRRKEEPAAERSLEFTDFLESVHPADRENVRRAARDALARDAEFDTEYRVKGTDGEEHWIVARGRVDHAASSRLVGVSINITARKRAELQSAQDRAALRHITRVSMLGQLSASIAHQLNQPLAAILGNAEAARKMLGRGQIDVDELRDICDDIVTEDHRAAEVIRRLRDLYKRGEMNLEPLDVNSLVSETLGLVSTELLTRHVSAIADVAPSLPRIDAGRVQLQQVLLNLIMNAADAMGGNAPDDRIVTVRTEPAGTEIRLAVVDRGSGIAEENLKNVFDAFWTTKHEGMGVGLAICQTIVAAHGGRITAANNSDGGATFCVMLPVRAPA
jgi:C4-dicarboxylate-specific signal transduction histidine kinase